jgi:phosphatidylglycerol:prolipoprotein diacylglycerol transferase
VILYNVERFFLEMLRADSARFLFNWTAAQWTALPAVILALAVGVVLAYQRQSKNDQTGDGTCRTVRR